MYAATLTHAMLMTKSEVAKTRFAFQSEDKSAATKRPRTARSMGIKVHALTEATACQIHAGPTTIANMMTSTSA
jgi:hypothetical protein